jgi:hypothetical protein
MICFKKSLDGKEIVILVNVREAAIGFDVPSELQSITRTEIRSGESVQFDGMFSLSSYQYPILQP